MKYKKILIRSSWQSVNIGDIAHTPGLLSLLQHARPDLQLTLWPCDVGRGVKEMLQHDFPDVEIVEGEFDSKEVLAAFEQNDFLLHGSGPSVVCSRDLDFWRKNTEKPYGIFGVTIEKIDDDLKAILDSAEFVYCRDTVSVDVLKAAGVNSPIIDFAPDATFSFDLRDDEAAAAFLSANYLEHDKFVCVIPRLRYTPYHNIHKTKPTDENIRRDKINDEFAAVDHEKMLEAMYAILEKTNLKILICAEMTYEVELGKELLYNLLDSRYHPRVVWRDSYWRPNEAASVYAAANSMISFEMHSPIIALATRTPAIYLRQPTDTSKGQMWRDIGLDDWIFEIDETISDEIASEALNIISNPEKSQKKAAAALKYARKSQFGAVAACL